MPAVPGSAYFADERERALYYIRERRALLLQFCAKERLTELVFSTKARHGNVDSLS